MLVSRRTIKRELCARDQIAYKLPFSAPSARSLSLSLRFGGKKRAGAGGICENVNSNVLMSSR